MVLHIVGGMMDMVIVVIHTDEAGIDVQAVPDLVAGRHAEVLLQHGDNFLLGIKGDGQPVRLPVIDGGQDPFTAIHRKVSRAMGRSFLS